MKVLIRVPAVLLQVQLPADVPGAAAGDGSSICVSSTHVGILNRISDSWRWLGSVHSIATITVGNQWMEDSLSFYL